MIQKIMRCPMIIIPDFVQKTILFGNYSVTVILRNEVTKNLVVFRRFRQRSFAYAKP